VPPALGGSFSLETGWGSGGTAGFYGGFGRTQSVGHSPARSTSTSGSTPSPARSTRSRSTCRRTTTATINPLDDDEFQFNCVVVSPTGPCATAGGGWQLVSIPSPTSSTTTPSSQGQRHPRSHPGLPWRQRRLINVVVAVIGTGTDVNFRTDYWAFSDGLILHRLRDSTIVEDFENGVAPARRARRTDARPRLLHLQRRRELRVTVEPRRPRRHPFVTAGSPNSVLQMDVNSTSFAGFIHGFPATPQDWSTSEGISFWMFGTGSGSQLFIDILDNRNPGSTTDDAERFGRRSWTTSPAGSCSSSRSRVRAQGDRQRRAPTTGSVCSRCTATRRHPQHPGGARTYYVDDVASTASPSRRPSRSSSRSRTRSSRRARPGNVAVKLNRPMGPDDPAR
jgi:hypothetical protein